MNRVDHGGVLLGPRGTAVGVFTRRALMAVRVVCLILLLLVSGLGQEQELDAETETDPRQQVLTLRGALVQAIAAHPRLEQALAGIEAQEFGVLISTGPRYPKFSFQASGSQSGFEGQPGGSEVVRTGIQRSYGYGISLSQQIFDFGRTKNSIKLSELELSATRLSYMLIRQSVLDDVVQAYFEVLRQDQAITVNEENVRNAEAVLAQASGFLEAGTGAKIDVTQAEANLADARSGLVQSKGAYARSRAALALAMGLDTLGEVAVEEAELEIPDWDPETVRSFARTLRPDVAAASIDVAQAETRVKLAKAEYYPTISANAGYNWSDQTFPPNNTSYRVGINLSVPLINEPELSSGVGLAEANVKAAVAGFRNVELAAVQEAVSALYSLQEAIGRADSAGEFLRFAQESYRLSSERYKVGVANSVEVSQAQQRLVEARSQELQARFDVQNAVSTLLRTTGKLDAASLLPEELVLDPIFELPERVQVEE